ncbi:DUF3558 domain-containing protein [Kibdelosporangium persicum]|uniref:DUF3558 domain-containing protein n=1 Tax=Kibdelosporangium persicum TaxID=2698649 RepID=A0ABX2EZJ7_9PSEU|nr:DUF3558 domain-containing protein [Kibdelosporangium persicum]NRN64093.1 hypothetical protein [Kibdelosporangium persicum]
MTRRVVACLLILAAGCTASPPNEEQDPPPTTHVPAPWRGIPPTRPQIPPLDASRYGDKPCDLFTDEQAKALGYVRERDPLVETDVQRCIRRAEYTTDTTLTILFYPDADHLGRIYRREAEWPANDATARDIGGQPAVSVVLDRQSTCWLVVGLTDTQSVEVRTTNTKSAGCDQATGIAEAIVARLR